MAHLQPPVHREQDTPYQSGTHGLVHWGDLGFHPGCMELVGACIECPGLPGAAARRGALAIAGKRGRSIGRLGQHLAAVETGQGGRQDQREELCFVVLPLAGAVDRFVLAGSASGSAEARVPRATVTDTFSGVSSAPEALERSATVKASDPT